MLMSILLYYMCGVVVSLAGQAVYARQLTVEDIIFSLVFRWALSPIYAFGGLVFMFKDTTLKRTVWKDEGWPRT